MQIVEAENPTPAKSEAESQASQVDPGESVRIFNGINVGAQTVTPATEHLPEEQKRLVRWLHWYAREQKWTWDDLVKAVGYSSTTWSRIFRDAYRYAKGEARAGERMAIDDHCRAIARFEKIIKERESVIDTGFIETSVWHRIEWLCRRALVRNKIGFIWGESQIGKSQCVREFRRRNNHGKTTYAEMPPSSGVQHMLRSFADALTVPSATAFEKLLKDVCQALDSSKLLIIDEIHRVFTTYQKTSVMRCLDTIRYIYDTTGCGLVLVGTPQMREQLERGQFAQYLKQLQRRGHTLMLQLPIQPPREDLDLMAEAFGLEPAEAGSEAEQVLLQDGKKSGFGPVKMLFQDASERAAKRRRKVEWADYIWASDIAAKMARGEEIK